MSPSQEEGLIEAFHSFIKEAESNPGQHMGLPGYLDQVKKILITYIYTEDGT